MQCKFKSHSALEFFHTITLFATLIKGNSIKKYKAVALLRHYFARVNRSCDSVSPLSTLELVWRDVEEERKRNFENDS